jgi:hypothetical protein
MLERVGIGQTRFNLPGLALDSRGAALGRTWLARFGALDRLVSFLRIWSTEQVLDDLQPGLRIVQVRREGGTREVLLICSVASAAMADAAARAARLAGGQGFTGHGKHFVQGRDGRAPLGYDVAALESFPGVDFVLYSAEQTTAHTVVSELTLEKLLLRLELQRDPAAALRLSSSSSFSSSSSSPFSSASPGSPASDATGESPRWLVRVRRGLGPRLLEYVLRIQQRAPELGAAAGLCDVEHASRFERGPDSFWLFRFERAPRRLLQVLARTPGMTLFAPVGDRLAVAFGFRHPIALGGCQGQFSPDRLYLFAPAAGAGGGVTTVAPVPTLTPVADLVKLHETSPLSLAHELSATVVAHLAERPDSDLRAPLRLEPAPAGARGPAVATLVPWRQAGWLRALCYALPPSALQRHRVAVLARGILVVADGPEGGQGGQGGQGGPAGQPGAPAPVAIEGFPFGQLFHAPAPGLLVPIGRCLRPAIPASLLAERLRATDGSVVVFPGNDDAHGPGGPTGARAERFVEPAFRVPAESLHPLEARLLSELELRELPAELDTLPGSLFAPEPEIEIENQSVGFLPLWRIGR